MSAKTTRWLAAGLILPALAGCGLPATSDVTAAQGGTLHLLSRGDLAHLDPARTYQPSQLHIQLLYAPTLTSYVNKPGPAGTAIGADAATDTGRRNADATRWSFTIRKNLKWQDGKPVTCEDFRYGVSRSFSDLLAGGPSYQKNFLAGGDTYPGIYKDARGIPSVSCAGDTITYQLRKPVADFGYTVSLGIFAAVRKDKDTKTAYDAMPFSYGPYLIASHVRDKSLRLVRNPYWDQKLDAIRRNLPDVLDFQFGQERDVITDRLTRDRGTDQQTIPYDSDITQADAPRILADPKLRPRVLAAQTGGTEWVAINTRKVPDLNCRRAYLFALNRKSFLTALGGPTFGDYATTVASPLTKAYRKIDPYDLSGKLEGDPAKARRLLAQSPACPRSITFDYGQSPARDRMAASVIESFARVGITVKANPIQPKDLYKTVGKPVLEHELVFTGWQADWPSGNAVFPPLFAGNLIVPDGNSNLSQLNDPKVNEAIAAADRITDTAKAQEKWAEVDRLVQEAAAIIPIRYYRTVQITGSKVTGAYVHSIFMDVSLANVGVRP